MQLETQTRLLRVLSNGEFYRVGGREPIKVNVRIITATHQNIEDLVKEGLFREDLFHRLNVIKISLPNLNERKEDIPLLVKHFFHKSSEELKEEKKYLSEEVENYFTTLNWPGNVRQLENTCRWLTVMSPTREVKLEDLPDELKLENIEKLNDWTKVLQSWSESYLAKGKTDLLEEAIPEFEKTLIKVALNKTLGRKKEAADLLGWGRNTLTRKIKDLGLDK
jgi:two-component system nitrogen regulation response regulator GlnG